MFFNIVNSYCPLYHQLSGMCLYNEVETLQTGSVKFKSVKGNSPGLYIFDHFTEM